MYYTLLQRFDGRWAFEFGDVNVNEVIREANELRGQGIANADLRIMRSEPDVVQVFAAIALLNLKERLFPNAACG